jgi:hypothetical protein
MNRTEFERIRDNPDKEITHDIRFKPVTGKQALEFEGIPVAISGEPYVMAELHGAFTPRLNKVKYNVTVKGVGPICRVDVNGVNHGDAGRTHKHSLELETCPQSNLPLDVVARPDLAGLTARQVFEDFCKRAKIKHSGQFFDP